MFNEDHLRRVLRSYFSYYHDWRTHLSLDMDCPEARDIQGPEVGEIIEVPEVGGLHHHYERRAAGPDGAPMLPRTTKPYPHA